MAIGTIVAGIIAGAASLYSSSQASKDIERAAEEQKAMDAANRAESRRRERLALAEQRKMQAEEKRRYEQQRRDALKMEEQRKTERQGDMIRGSVQDKFAKGQNLLNQYYQQRAQLGAPAFSSRRR